MTWSALVTLLVGFAVAVCLVAFNDPVGIVHLVVGAGWGILAVSALRLPQILFAALGLAPLIEGPNRPGWAVLFRLRWIRDAVNALLPVAQVGGDFVRASLLIRRGTGTAPAAAGIAVDLATEMAAQVVFAVMGLVLLLRLPHQGAAIEWMAAATAVGGAMSIAFLAAQRWGLFRLVDRLLPRLAGSAAGMDGLHQSVVRLHRAPRRLWLSGTAHLVSWMLGTFETWAALRVLGVEVGLAEALVIESLSQMVRSLGFAVPGAVGVQEGGFVLACGLFGIPPEQAIALALLRRIRDILFGLPGIIAWRWEAVTDARTIMAANRLTPRIPPR